MRISEKIGRLRDVVQQDPDGKLCTDIKDESIRAILGGYRSDDWRIYMSRFCSNPEQLERLCGNDDAFMHDLAGYGPQSLAYIVGGGPCGGGTCLGMGADMPPDMRMHLDGNINLATDPEGPCRKLPDEANDLIKLEHDLFRSK